MKKILFITNRLVVGGPSVHISDLALGLSNDFEILIIGGEAGKGEVNALDLFHGLQNEPIILKNFGRKINLFNDWKSFRQIRKIIREYQPDIVHTHTAKAGFLGRFIPIYKDKIVYIHTFHGNLFRSYFNSFFTQGIKILERLLARDTDKIIALCKSQKRELKDLARIGNSSKFEIIQPGVDIQKFKFSEQRRKKFRNNYHLGDSDIAIGMVGRLAKIKNIEYVLQHLREIKEKHPDKNIYLFLIGDGPEKNFLQRYCTQINLKWSEFSSKRDNHTPVVFTSWNFNVAEAYCGLDALLLSSLNEGYPYSLMEAQLSGLPVVAADVGGVSDLLQDAKCGYVYHNDIEFLDLVSECIQNIHDKKVDREAIRNAIVNQHDKNRMIENHRKLYLDLLS